VLEKVYFCGGKKSINLTQNTQRKMEKKDSIEEARRYVANAEEVIRKAEYDPELNRYTDGKYVKMAGNTLWNGSLIALDALFGISKRKGRPDIDKYKDAAWNRDRKLLAYIVDGYETMHLHMGYDGTKIKKTCDVGFELANAIIDRCEKLLPVPVCA
jgi:hypothetical protein